MRGIISWDKAFAHDLTQRLDRAFFYNDKSPMRCDIIDQGDQYYLIAELPGFDKEDIKVLVEDDILRIQAQMSLGEKTIRRDFIIQERHHSSLVRCFNVRGVDEEKIHASFHNGILSVILPKTDTEKADLSRSVEIN
ncbi:MAG: Hsp20 family protein [Bacillota bacterium]|jgi:HSP20 family protein